MNEPDRFFDPEDTNFTISVGDDEMKKPHIWVVEEHSALGEWIPYPKSSCREQCFAIIEKGKIQERCPLSEFRVSKYVREK